MSLRYSCIEIRLCGFKADIYLSCTEIHIYWRFTNVMLYSPVSHVFTSALASKNAIIKGTGEL